MGKAFNLGKLFGIQFRLHFSWFIIFGIVTFSLAWQFFPAVSPGGNAVTYWIVGIVTSLLFFASLLTHELAHSLVGRANGIQIKSITLFIFGGVAQMTRDVSRHDAELKMAAAGPLTSLVIGGLFFGIHFAFRSLVPAVGLMTLWLGEVNLMLAAFNLIPGFPLDGGRVFRSLLWRFSGNFRRSTRIATTVGRGVAYVFIGGGILLTFFVRGQWFNGLWLVFIGWFLDSAAASSYHQALWRVGLQDLNALQVMSRECPVVAPDVTLGKLVQEQVLTRGQRCFMVAEGPELKGILTLENIKSAPRSAWDVTRVTSMLTPLERVPTVPPEQGALSVLEMMDDTGVGQVLVVQEEGSVRGLISRDNLIGLMRVRSDLGLDKS